MEHAIKKSSTSCSFTIADKYPDLQLVGRYERGRLYGDTKEYLEPLSSFDVIIKSPGIPPNQELRELGAKVTSSTQIFLDSIKDSGALVIGITGSKGKSTTSTLIYELLKAGGKNAFLIGNIGKPSIEYIDQAKPGVIFVLEMSSYQLMDLTTSPQIAVVTSFFPEHLDYHGSLEAYKEAKKHITRFQTKDDIVFYNGTSDGAKEIAMESSPLSHRDGRGAGGEGHAKRVPFSADECPVPIFKTKLLGEHNRSNIAGAYKVARHLGVTHDTCLDVIKTFRGLPHRLQSLGVHHGIEWIDDAISTTPESTIAALDALGDRVQTIILGGQDRGNDFTELGKRIVASHIKNVILFPGSGPRIEKAIEAAMLTSSKDGQWIVFNAAADMKTAVHIATLKTKNQERKTAPICLLSTASPSYGMFKNFEEKGERFAKAITDSTSLSS
jgi:UDP-N-acetylmuramoylalanine--D-glutamate ligase